MIGYFIKTGGTDVSTFGNLIWDENSLKPLTDQYVNIQNYGIDLILIKFIVDGSVVTFKENKKTITYSDNEIAVDINIRNNFWQLNQIEKKNYLMNSIFNKIKTLKNNNKTNQNIDFDKLSVNLETLSSKYLQNTTI